MKKSDLGPYDKLRMKIVIIKKSYEKLMKKSYAKLMKNLQRHYRYLAKTYKMLSYRRETALQGVL